MASLHSVSNEPPKFHTAVKSKAKAKSVAINRAGDDRLWKLHDKFVLEYAGLQSLDTPEMQAGSGSCATPQQKRAFKVWEKQLSVVDAACRAVIAAKAATLNGMLMKIHIAGFTLDCAGRSFSAPYHGQITSDGQPQAWTPHDVFGDNDTIRLIVSLRRDLHGIAKGGLR